MKGTEWEVEDGRRKNRKGKWKIGEGERDGVGGRRWKERRQRKEKREMGEDERDGVGDGI